MCNGLSEIEYRNSIKGAKMFCPVCKQEFTGMEITSRLLARIEELEERLTSIGAGVMELGLRKCHYCNEWWKSRDGFEANDRFYCKECFKRQGSVEEHSDDYEQEEYDSAMRSTMRYVRSLPTKNIPMRYMYKGVFIEHFIQYLPKSR